MTAIAGVISSRAEIDVSSACKNMLAVLSLYGDDHRAHYASHCFAMGLCLLRLLPEDKFDRQPLTASNVTAFIGDVRLDNRQQLAEGLGWSSLQLAVAADSDLLLAAWLRWGEACVDHIYGAFAFAVWQEADQSLFLARDHTGERPLFYAASPHGFAFASMPKGLHALPWIPAEIDEDYVARYLTLADTPVEQTIFRHIRRLPAGCSLRVRGGDVQLQHYWRTDRLPALRLRSPQEYLECFLERFDSAVSARLRTPGGVGAQLSGGLDSGAVAATAAGLLGAQGRELTCFTAVPRPGSVPPPGKTHFYDEGPAAAEAIAQYSNTRHVLVESSDTSFLDILDHNNDLYDHPCFGPSNEVWSNAIYDRARASGITVLLNGSCGNFTFSYEGMGALSAWFRSGQWRTLLRVARRLAQSRTVSRRWVVRNAVWPSLPLWLRSWTDPHSRDFSLDYSMLHPALAQQLDLRRIAFEDMHRESADGRTMLRRLLDYGDVGDAPIAAQGGWGIDYRDPTYDRRIVEFCLTVPLEEFLRDGQLRSLARRSMQGRLPASTLQRTQRGSQSADWHISLAAVRGRMAAEVEHLRTSPLAARMLDLDRMGTLIEHWPTGGFEADSIRRSYYMALTRGFSVGKFLLHYDRAR